MKSVRPASDTLSFIELIPYSRDEGYVKKIQKNVVLYSALANNGVKLTYIPKLELLLTPAIRAYEG